MNRALVSALLPFVFLVGCQPDAKTSTGPPTNQAANPNPDAQPPVDALKDLKVEDIEVGKGPIVAEGDMASVEYTLALKDGKLMDDNVTKLPLGVFIGSDQQPKGLQDGLKGMKVGGRRKISVPYALGFNDAEIATKSGTQSIPKYSDLFYTVKLLHVVKKGEEGVYDKQFIKRGSGPAAKVGNTVSVHYTGTLLNGQKFGSSREENKPIQFRLGAGSVISGWEAALKGLKVGDRVKVTLPPSIAYGAQDKPGIGPNQVLIFDIEIMGIKP